MAKNLVIVESPAKAKTLANFLGGKYSVKASLGHVRDLPKSRLGVDVQNGFTPKYLVPKEKKEVVRDLKGATKSAKVIYLATDPDREGEAISWHLVEAMELAKLPVTIRRVVFHEITREAIEEAFKDPRDIDFKLVNAQQTRRILDRLVGYMISPLLWRKVKSGLSAGRVQSVALRMIVDREREIQAFVPEEYWSIEAELAKRSTEKKGKAKGFLAALVGRLGTREKLEISNKEAADRLIEELKGAGYSVNDIKQKQVKRQPSPPFTTSTMQQEASRKLRFTAKKTMSIAQQLYEGLPIGKEGTVGLITYMRTDSTNVAASALTETRSYIGEKFGANFMPHKPRYFAKKAKGAQEAHEAIRPTSVRREPAILKQYLTHDQFRLYELIWKRMLASQMADAIMDTTSVDIEARPQNGNAPYLFRATSSVVHFPGFLVLYQEGKDENGENGKKEQALPSLSKGEPLDLIKLLPEQHFTQPPPRYTEASLIKALEENGIGRPSTYAPILSTIEERSYVAKVERRFQPLELGFIVSDLLTEHFPDIVDTGFTAEMEKELDEIAQGKREWVPVLQAFYNPFEKRVEVASTRIEKIQVPEEPTGENCELCGKPLLYKTGRYGRFIACSGFPACKNTKPIRVKIGVKCPTCGGELIERKGRRGRVFYGCSNYPNCKFSSYQRPMPQPCPRCGGLLTKQNAKHVQCKACGFVGQMADIEGGTAEEKVLSAI